MAAESGESSVVAFYEALSPFYHLIFEDWNASIERQAAALDSIVCALIGHSRHTVLDVACGIGTQSLGLAALGYDVTASDIAAAAVERARAEAAQRELRVRLSVADMREAFAAHGGREFDVVLCADNSLPHLLSDGEIESALAQFLLCTRPGGLCAISMRDYDQIERGEPAVQPYALHRDGEHRTVLLQVREWNGALYDLRLYIVDDDGESCRAQVSRTTYYAIPVAAVSRMMERVGFTKVRRIDDRFFQPLIVGVRPNL